MWTISKLTIKEILYKRIFTVIFILSLVFLIFYGVGTYFAQNKMASSANAGMSNFLGNTFISTQLYGMGLYFSTFIISLLAIFSAASSISKEIESQQIDPMLSRPLSRQAFMMGRFIGLSGLLILYSLFLFVGVTLINQFVGGDLKMVISMEQFSKALMLFLLQPIILISISLLFSTRFSSLNSGIIMVMLYVITMIGGFVEQLGAVIKDQSMVYIGIVTSLLFPLDSLFRKMTICLFDAADNPISFATQGIFSSSSVPSNFMIGYAVLYGVLAMVLATRLFMARDL